MSTYWHYECLDHDPPLQAEEEFTQHTDDRHYDRGVALIGQRPVDLDDSYWQLGPAATSEERSDAYFNMNARRFLTSHPKCRIGVVSEYGDRPEEGTYR